MDIDLQNRVIAQNTATRMALGSLFAALTPDQAAEVQKILGANIQGVQNQKDASMPINVAIVEELNVLSSLLDR